MTAAPERTCAGCRESFPQEALVRLAVVPEAPYLVPDARRKLGGRGVWVQPRRECIERAARKGGFSRALRTKVSIDPSAVEQALVGQLERRLDGLVQGARRAGQLALGTDAVRESLRNGRTTLLWLTEDAAGRREELLAMAGDKGAEHLCFGTKHELGQKFGRDTLGVVAVEDEGLARALGQVIGHLAGLRGLGSVPHKKAGDDEYDTSPTRRTESEHE